MGNLDGRRKLIQSTNKDSWEELLTAREFCPDQPDDTPEATTASTPLRRQEASSTDQTGRLPHPSESGKNYLLVAYDHDSNVILLRPNKN
jgi:hypothetical protein